jgi:reactive intermediate/imine deaminase
MLERILICGVLVAAVPTAAAGDLETLATWMSGSFSSQAQSQEDPAYYDIRLEMEPIWTEREDGIWLYVEQAAASSLDRPYRQRVYHLTTQEDGSFRSDVFEIPDALEHAGVWRNPKPLQQLSPDDLTLREGCAVILRKQDDANFAGSTVEDACTSSLRGASYATSEVIVRPDGIESWDRGYDAEGKQVWGAEKGAYVFDRKPRPFRVLDSGSVFPSGLPFSEAVRVGDTLFLSGQIGNQPGTLELVPGGIEAETRQTLENVKRTLEAHGFSMRDIVKCTVMMADISEWATFNEIYEGYFDTHYPARSAFGANGLALGARVELDCIAAADGQ